MFGLYICAEQSFGTTPEHIGESAPAPLAVEARPSRGCRQGQRKGIAAEAAAAATAAAPHAAVPAATVRGGQPKGRTTDMAACISTPHPYKAQML